jgi:hypothetical protein
MTPERFTHELDQAAAGVRDARADKQAAHAESRCVVPPFGCGQPLPRHISAAFRDRPSRAEYDLNGLCQACQDAIFAPSLEEVAEMAADPERYGRCETCGAYREYEFVDVGIGVMKGFDCCRPELSNGEPLPRCGTHNHSGRRCWLRQDHFHGHDFGEPS